uniref:Aspartate aminotransferase n=1 Tax=Strombidium inclinatum TaxID=197538 RepID=A0A7S3N2D6_9SPIT
MGAYRTDEGKPLILPAVHKAAQIILDKKMDHEYAPIDGQASYQEKCATLAFGEGSSIVSDNRYTACQGISGTGSIRLFFDFMHKFFPNKSAKVWVPTPTWPTHKGIANAAGLDWAEYRYYDSNKRVFDVNGMLEDLDKAPAEQIILLHTCAHNPTGCDPTQDDWKQIFEVCKRKGHFCAFDNAYQGFASGDLDKDSFSLRHFAHNYDRVAVLQSFAKNFGLYGERAGCVHFVTSDAAESQRVSSRIKQIARPTYSSPPIHGARLVDVVLGDKDLTASWHQSLVDMSSRMNSMRIGFREKLESLGSTHDWSHITTQIGMFAYTGITTKQVNQLKDEKHIYMTGDGRISIAGLNTGNLDYVSEAFHNVTKHGPLGTD